MSFVSFQNEPDGHFSNFWLTTIVVKSKKRHPTNESIRLGMEKENIETRPLWKPMHLQPVFSGCPSYVNGQSESLFNFGLCLPSGSNLTDEDFSRISDSLHNNLS